MGSQEASVIADLELAAGPLMRLSMRKAIGKSDKRSLPIFPVMEEPSGGGDYCYCVARKPVSLDRRLTDLAMA